LISLIGMPHDSADRAGRQAARGWYQLPSVFHMMASTAMSSMQMMVRRPMRFILVSPGVGF
jgi:hypothetical protein